MFPIDIFEIDHIRPRSKGGADVDENLQLLCPTCNGRKGNRSMGYLLDLLSQESMKFLMMYIPDKGDKDETRNRYTTVCRFPFYCERADGHSKKISLASKVAKKDVCLYRHLGNVTVG